MVSGFCAKRGRQIGGFMRPALWQCPTCRKIWCEGCPKRRIGRVFRKLVCPECEIEMKEGGLESVRKSMYG